MKRFITHLAFQETRATARTWLASLTLAFVSSLLILSSLSFVCFPSQAKKENISAISQSVLDKFSGLGEVSLIIYMIPAVAITVIVNEAVIARLRPRQAAIFLTGATPKQMGSVFRWQIIIVAAVGYVVSLLVWAVCSPFVMSWVSMYFGGQQLHYHLGSMEFLLSLVLTLTQILISAWATTRKFVRTPPMEFLSQTQSKRKSMGSVRLTITVLSLALLLASAWLAYKMVHDSVPLFVDLAKRDGDTMADVWSAFTFVPIILALPLIIGLVAGGPVWNTWIIQILSLASSFKRSTSRWWMIATRQAEQRLSTSSAAAMPIAAGFTLLFLTLVPNTTGHNVCTIYTCTHHPDSLGQFLVVFLPTALVILVGVMAIVVLTNQEQRRDTNAVQLAGLVPADSYIITLCEALILEIIIICLSLIPTGLAIGFTQVLVASKGYEPATVGISIPVVAVSYLASFVILTVLLWSQTRFSLRNPLYRTQE